MNRLVIRNLAMVAVFATVGLCVRLRQEKVEGSATTKLLGGSPADGKHHCDAASRG